MRAVSIARAALAVLILGCALAACASADGTAAGKQPGATPATPAASSPARSSPLSPASAAPPDVTVVRLAAGFSPATLRLRVGQQFLLTVSPGVQARGLDAAGCASGRGETFAGGC
jgi:glucose/arabinose dehydrogenase